jgi:4-diphosphocytidyl-2-C-methyl-D-erythritol kinase
MISYPNCKINLGLKITEKRKDGFHNVETVMYPVQFCDVLEMILASDSQFEFNTSGIPTGSNKMDNLVVKAYNLISRDFNIPAVKIHLHKQIPAGAGLGGGSSDAAFTIKSLNVLFNLNLSRDTMENYARMLGADCPFFIHNEPVLATAKGDDLEPVLVNLNSYYILIVKPELSISTSEAYSWITPHQTSRSLKEIICVSPDLWTGMLENDFEPEIFTRYSQIKQIKDELYSMGAFYASLTGSGSAMYGIFKSPVNIEDKFPNYSCWTGKLT